MGRPKNQIKTDWSPELAYAVGLIATDGSLSKNGRHIDLTSKDKEQIINFKNCLGVKELKIGTKSDGSNQNRKYYRVQIGDVSFYEWLEDIGLRSNKSKNMGSLKIPNEYFFDFLRGCFDGDGAIYSFWDKRWKNSFMFYLQFTSSSPSFLNWLQKMISKLSEAEGVLEKSQKNQGVQNLKFAKKETLIVFNKMFYDEKVSHLSRKFKKAQKIFKINKENKKE